jgi:CheY-like chemotaxis protein
MRSSKVLLLENVAAQAAAARNALVGAGYRLLISRFEAEERKRAREWKPDIVIVSSAYVKDDYEAFCRSLRSEIPTSFSLVIAASEPAEQFFGGMPGLRRLVDGYVQRPYSAARLREALQSVGATGPAGSAETPPQEPGPDVSLQGRSVLLLDHDPDVVANLREFLEPKGVGVKVTGWEEAAAAGGADRFQALVLGWPLPEGLTVDALRAIRGGGEALPIVILSSSGQDVVQARTPALLRMSNMLFIKPVPWKHFFRFLTRLLRQAPAAPASKKVIPLPAASGDDLRARFQQQLEEKFLEVEELKARLRALEKTGGGATDTAVHARLREENAGLQARARELEKKAEVDMAKHQLRETELEVRLGSLIRKKSEAERRAQDLIDAGTDRADEMARGFEESLGELQVRDEEVAALRKDLEMALVEKESSEENLQAALMEIGKEKDELGRERQSLRADSEKAVGVEAELQEKEKEFLRASEEGRRRESLLEEELAELQSRVEESGREAADLDRMKEMFDSSAGELEGLRGLLERKEHSLKDLEEKLATSEMAVAGLDEEVGGWRHRCAEAEAAMADLAAREAQLQREKEERETFAPVPVEPERDVLLDESRKILAELEEKLGATEEARSELEGLLAEKESRLEALEKTLGERDLSHSGQEELLAEKEVALGALREELGAVERSRSEMENLLAGKEDALGALREELGAVEKSRSEMENLLAEKEDALGALREELGAVEKSRSEMENLLAEKEDASARLLEEERARASGLETELERSLQELDAFRGRIEEAEQQRRDADGVEASLEERLRELEQEVAGGEAARKELEERRGAAERAGRERIRELEELLEQEKVRAREAGSAEDDRASLQQLLEDVVSRAQEEVVERTRKEVELRERLKTSLEEKKFFLTRLERELREAGERERRLSDLLDKALRGSAQLAASLGDGGGSDNLPVAFAEPARRPLRLRPVLAASLAGLLLAGGGWLALRDRGDSGPAAEKIEAPAVVAKPPGPDPLSSQREVWEQWTRSDVSGGVLLQATLRSPQEIAAEVEAEKTSRGWSDQEARRQHQALLEPYRFEDNFYFYLYLKNLEPGYPSYIDDIYTQLSLRDDKGNEAGAFLPPDLEKYRRVYSFTSGDLSKSRDGLIYEVTVPVAFSRAALAGNPSYIQLLAYNLGSSSRRVLTWEME